MKLAVRAAKVDVIKSQPLTSLESGAEDIVATATNYSGITILKL